jgi:hypothetical protein
MRQCQYRTDKINEILTSDFAEMLTGWKKNSRKYHRLVLPHAWQIVRMWREEAAKQGNILESDQPSG